MKVIIMTLVAYDERQDIGYIGIDQTTILFIRQHFAGHELSIAMNSWENENGVLSIDIGIALPILFRYGGGGTKVGF